LISLTLSSLFCKKTKAYIEEYKVFIKVMREERVVGEVIKEFTNKNCRL